MTMQFRPIEQLEQDIMTDLRTKDLIHSEVARLMSHGRTFRDVLVAYRSQKNGFTSCVVRIGPAIFVGASKRMRTDRNSVRGRCLAFRRAVGVEKSVEEELVEYTEKSINQRHVDIAKEFATALAYGALQ